MLHKSTWQTKVHKHARTHKNTNRRLKKNKTPHCAKSAKTKRKKEMKRKRENGAKKQIKTSIIQMKYFGSSLNENKQAGVLAAEVCGMDWTAMKKGTQCTRQTGWETGVSSWQNKRDKVRGGESLSRHPRTNHTNAPSWAHPSGKHTSTSPRSVCCRRSWAERSFRLGLFGTCRQRLCLKIEPRDPS